MKIRRRIQGLEQKLRILMSSGGGRSNKQYDVVLISCQFGGLT